MDSFDADLFEEKLLHLKDSQDSIASLSLWCLSHKEHHEKIVTTWLNVLRKVRVKHRLLLFYLANDVIQYSKRKSLQFVNSFALSLQRATKLVREDSVRNKIMRLFKIWSEREIYEEAFLVDLSNLLNRSQKYVTNTDVQEFQSPALFAKIRKCKELEVDTDVRLNTLNKNYLSITDVEKLRNSLKDKEHGDELLFEYDSGIGTVKAYIKALETEINERLGLINLLEIAEEYYEREFEEAKVVVNAYKCFATRVRGVNNKLEDQIKKWPSPVPSPDAYAPSPSPEPNDVSSCKPNDYFPSNEIREVNDDVTPYSPKSDFDPEPLETTYFDNPQESQMYEFQNSSLTDDFQISRPNAKRPHYSSEMLHNNALNQEHSFCSATSASASKQLKANISEITTSEAHQLSLSALLQTLIPSKISAHPSVPTNGNPLLNSPKSDVHENSWDSPESPPLYEKAKYPNIADEQMLNQDIDMRNVDKNEKSFADFADSSNRNWSIDDMDYRTAGKAQETLTSSYQSLDNVENIDMEMSDDEEKQNKNKESDAKNLLQPNNRLCDVLNVSLQNPKIECSKFNNISMNSSFMHDSLDENLTKPVMLPQNSPLLSGNNSSVGPAYRIDPAGYAAFSNKNIRPFNTCYPDFISSVSGKGDTCHISNSIDSFSNLQPPLPPILPPPPPPPPPHPPLWSYNTPLPPPQFATPPNYMQQSVFFPGPPPPGLPTPQMPILSRQYRANFRPFQRVPSRFQRWST